MKIEYYRNFVTIVESGSLTAAAEKLSIAQPSLSVQLKKLEQIYNIKLIVLSPGISKLELTDAGKIFYEKAKYICTLDDSTQMELINFAKGLAGTIRISISPAKVASFITNFIEPFQKKYPLINYEIREAPVDEQINHILNGISDFAIANAPLPEPHRFDIVFSEKDHLTIVMNKKNPWISNKSTNISLISLKDIPISINFGCHKLFENACLTSGITPNFISICTTKTTALQFAALNLGIAVVPVERNEVFDKDLLAIPLKNNKLYVEKMLYKAKGKKFSPIVNNFIDFYLKKSFKIENVI